MKTIRYKGQIYKRVDSHMSSVDKLVSLVHKSNNFSVKTAAEAVIKELGHLPEISHFRSAYAEFKTGWAEFLSAVEDLELKAHHEKFG